MANINIGYHAQFFTATILEWKYLLEPDRFKDIVVNSLLFLKMKKESATARYCHKKQGFLIIFFL